jgi:hypothetical protein
MEYNSDYVIIYIVFLTKLGKPTKSLDSEEGRVNTTDLGRAT